VGATAEWLKWVPVDWLSRYQEKNINFVEKWALKAILDHIAPASRQYQSDSSSSQE
jgi:hypothetical protein